MTFWTKWLPFVPRSRASSELNPSDNSYFLVQQFLEPFKLLFCLFVVETFTLKLRLKATYLRLQRRYLSFRLLKTVKRKRKTFANYLRYRQVLDRVSGNFQHAHIQALEQELSVPYNPIIRQVCNKIVYIDSWQSVTLTKRLSIKSSALPNLSQSKAMIFWNRLSLDSNYAKQKSFSTKPVGQKAVKKTRKVRFAFLGAYNILGCKRNGVRRLPFWFSARAFSFAASLFLFHLKKYIVFLERFNTYVFKCQETMAHQRMFKEKQALVLAALSEGTPMRAVARMFKTDKKRIARVIRETGEAFSDYMDRNFRDLPCLRIEMDEQWQFVGAHGSRLIKPEAERGDFWLWCCIDADTKLVISYKVGKRDWWTGNSFVEDVRNRVRLPVQIATDNHRPYAFHIRQHFGYEGYNYGTETKIFGERMLSDGTVARLGRNEGVRKMETAERRAVVGSPDLESLTTSHVERAFLTVRQELKRFERKGLGYSKSLEMHKLAVALHFGVYNFVRKHHTLGTTPAVAAGLEEKPWSLEQVVAMTSAYWANKS
jgi:IS1 family transposase